MTTEPQTATERGEPVLTVTFQRETPPTPAEIHDCAKAALNYVQAVADDAAQGHINFETGPLEWIDDGRNDIVIHVYLREAQP